MENCYIFIQISLKYDPLGTINNKPALFQIMDWYWTDDKPLSEPMMAKFTDTYMHHSASVG